MLIIVDWVASLCGDGDSLAYCLTKGSSAKKGASQSSPLFRNPFGSEPSVLARLRPRANQLRRGDPGGRVEGQLLLALFLLDADCDRVLALEGALEQLLG